MLRFFCFLAFNLACSLYAQKLRVFALAGQGSDCRIFDSLKLQEEVDFHCLTYSIPPKAARMEDYARILSAQIDTSNPFVLLGVSLGGMLACEMSEFLNPEQVVIISSAKGKKELPGRYRIFRKIPIYRLIPGTFFKWSAFVLQPIVEPDRNSRKELFVSMLRAKEALFLKRSIPMIVEWDKTSSCENCIHIHGTADRTLLLKHIDADYIIPGGSHMMCGTQSALLRSLLLELLEPHKP